MRTGCFPVYIIIFIHRMVSSCVGKTGSKLGPMTQPYLPRLDHKFWNFTWILSSSSVFSFLSLDSCFGNVLMRNLVTAVAFSEAVSTSSSSASPSSSSSSSSVSSMLSYRMLANTKLAFFPFFRSRPLYNTVVATRQGGLFFSAFAIQLWLLDRSSIHMLIHMSSTIGS